jgi:hypothetical protein
MARQVWATQVKLGGMSKAAIEHLLPKALIERASLRGNEYAWRSDDIPAVIEAARNANLINIGGQLQFRLPDGGTCECYWVDVDTFKSVPENLDWSDRVDRTAMAASADFAQLKAKYDFLDEGMRNFERRLKEFSKNGGDLNDAIWFVWYVEEIETPKS